jgi:dTDP-4-dehydrorhamnose 3,5-epimerase
MIQNMSAELLELKDSYMIKPFVAEDERGAFVKDYSKSFLASIGIHHLIQEVFYTISHKGVIRAIHFQNVKQQAKLVRCVSGKIYDVIVDLRCDSAQFGKWRGYTLSGDNYNELLVPQGFGHGYLVLEESIVSYKCAEDFYGEYDDGVIWNDADLGIEWPLDEIGGIANVIVSQKDKNLQSFQHFMEENKFV